MSQSLGQIENIREFNRAFSTDMGLFEKTPYDSSLSLVESRVVYELESAGELSGKELARKLSVDKGYLSRVLGTLIKRNVVKAESKETDRREKRYRLSALGHRKFRDIDKASRARTRNLLKSMGSLKAHALTENLSAAQFAMHPPARESLKITMRGLEPGDLGWVIGRQGGIYFREFGWNQDFEVLVAEIALAFVKRHDVAKERAWIAEARGVRLGCVFLVRENDETAKLRILFVEPFGRKLGVGARLVSECVNFAREAGYRKLTLWTNDVLVSARRIYEAEGFFLEKEDPHESFGKKLVGQYWAKKL